MTTTERPVRRDFAQRLRAETRAEHGRAHAQPYVRALLAGQLGAEDFAMLLAQHYFAYAVLEAAAEHMRSDLVAGPFVSDRLRRLPALEADLQHYFGRGWRRKVAPSAATEEYLARMREICFDWPGGFVAHHYTRYLADLSGGQAIRAIMGRSMDRSDGAGFAFLTFEQIPNGPRFKDAYRTLLDTVGWSAAEEDRIVAEVKRAYAHNTRVLAELSYLLIPRQR
ncbi:heme oxygenase [Saccharopolyspora antimicrobica]|uniref:Heme oxygenase n=1 Tax=Saccharopolyspora antimicrobica TaxID=455193 RepID=A0A1I4XLA9_9PSEU|nr:biliverdin-producing heme oxygenase [Saccharopolyspora antimicrobica]RKT84559.1 heme oxygenase [Saccharopolyspora antimicrobica]SFN26615.1 heme oxygenase [Saccharopolyspora antimicrobica]